MCFFSDSFFLLVFFCSVKRVTKHRALRYASMRKLQRYGVSELLPNFVYHQPVLSNLLGVRRPAKHRSTPGISEETACYDLDVREVQYALVIVVMVLMCMHACMCLYASVKGYRQ